MNKVIKSTVMALVSIGIVVGLTGCGGASAPDVDAMTKAIDKSLDKTFTSANNGGEVFSISDLVINKIDDGDEKGNFRANVTFKVTADNRPAGMAFSMSYSKRVNNIGRLKEGQSYIFENINVLIRALEDGGYSVTRLK